MVNSRLIELSYYDPSAQVRLTAYADTLVLDHNKKSGIISAVRFGGYPEMVRAMSDAIYGGATIEAVQNGTTRLLQSNPKGYRHQISHDSVYAEAILIPLASRCRTASEISLCRSLIPPVTHSPMRC